MDSGRNINDDEQEFERLIDDSVDKMLAEQKPLFSDQSESSWKLHCQGIRSLMHQSAMSFRNRMMNGFLVLIEELRQ